MNNYLSRYAKYDTHFHRTDPFKGASFDDEKEDKLILSVALVGFFALIAMWLIYVG